MARLGYVPALDGLRALAITLVLSFHAVGFRSGWLGVDLFFVLSGFLITTLLLERRGRDSIASFYRRRAVRLLPGLLVLLFVSLLVDRSMTGVLIGVGYFSNIVVAAGRPDLLPDSLHHLWSLAAEEQFYIVWPLVLYAALRLGARLALVLALGGIAASFAVSLWLSIFRHAPYHRLMFAPDTRSTSILVGCAVALVMVVRPLSLKRFEAPALALFAVVLLTMGHLAVFGPAILLFALASAVLVAAATQNESAVAGVLAFPPLVFLGRISYSLYLWHYPIFVWLGVLGGGKPETVLLGMGLAFAAACASYYLIEQPCLRRLRSGPSRGRRRSSLVIETPRVVASPS
jgi:peptidoglycan/LPS O-acetylase OafA/YrhL